MKKTGVRIGCSILTLLMLSAIFAPFLAPYSPFELRLEQGLSAPSSSHILGQDKLGRDVLSRLLYGGRVSLGVGLAVTTISVFMGIFIGSIAGFFGGRIDSILMRLVDIVLSFPGILLAIVMAAILGPSVLNIIVALSISGWGGYARLIRGQILFVRCEDYVAAAIAIGLPPWRVILRHLLPNVLAPVIVEAAFGMGHAIMAEASLSFLGLGIQPPMPSWGGMLSDSKSFLLLAPHLVTVPGLVIMAVVLACNLLGDSLRDSLSVRGQVM
ncbi:MAG: ABC transporter permease [Nitrospirae bacterium]|nr:ABC transporter permease [Candidatus Troglogloeales bacterium]MBI3598195.1 ABC transporter permease [Candidatus Troglogloeales bacterium]